MDDLTLLFQRAADVAARHRSGLPVTPVRPEADAATLRLAVDTVLREAPTPASEVLEELVTAFAPGLVATPGPRFFGFVIGGAMPAASAADMVAVGWDQCAFNGALSPAAAVAEEVAGGWLKTLLGLPPGASVGFVTGAQGANTVCLATARQHVLAEAGWDVGRDGLRGAPMVRVVAGAERHATIDRALRLLGFGTAVVEEVAADANGALDVADLAEVLDRGEQGPTIVCLQAGNVNTGACDDLRRACALARQHGAWVHVDGAFGLWAAASPTRAHLVDGIDLADSWSCDGHKWLNVPYDCGFAICAHPQVHAAALSYTAAYLTGQGGPTPAMGDLVPESSRRARGFAVWAALRELGRDGVADLVDRCCGLAQRFAEGLEVGGATVVNDVVLNQVLVSFGSDARTDQVIDGVQRDGTCWLGGTTWRGRRLMRVSVSNWSTTEADVDRSVAAILRVAAASQS
ncbi:glutamate/tyrosine decarboxylase-like PLP-dependent enzyme [Phycicoccus badiiscoriae]|uniref:Glutamate/tyrosine decarboxylase-like PLP-dependent enzyme n=1 Tax=Pedococcus badiiscoriae TaxID=642776 RepID=A0A852WJ84_9MICO|nr:aminotransferase class V-fold PLP-dependent enzyme [Pedococcus badiiscoriae]NYG05606.1 glutamate/tyrosine decarboxylase-like PLP-dependent enzyme [Pedococcus badiiscoriae]